MHGNLYKWNTHPPTESERVLSRTPLIIRTVDQRVFLENLLENL